MATSIKTIRNKTTEDVIYPITKASAVYLNDNVTTVENKINNINSSINSLDNDI